MIISDIFYGMSAVLVQRSSRGENYWSGPLLRRVDYLVKGNQLKCWWCTVSGIHLEWLLLNSYDNHDGENETGVNGDCSALLQMPHPPYSVRDSLSNHKDPSSLLLDKLSVGFKEMMRLKAVERNETSCGGKRGCHRCPAFWKKIKQVPH